VNYVISLSSALERREHIFEEFSKQSIDFEFFNAVEPDQLDFLENKYGISLKDSGLTAGEKACFFSHMELWNMAVEKNMPYITIFEDDILLGENVKGFLDEINWLPKDIDIVKLEFFSDRILMELNRKKINKYQHHRNLRALKEKHLGTAGYILSYKGALSYLNYIKNNLVSMPLDHIMFESYLSDGVYKVYQMTPALCIQADRYGVAGLESQLEYERTINRDNLKRDKVKLNFISKVKREVSRLIYQILLSFCKIRFK